MRVRRGITLVELLVVLGIIVLLIALLLPAIQNVREAGARMATANKMRQLVIATHNFACNQSDFLPRLTGRGSPALPMFIEMMPYLEQDSVYKEFLEATPNGGANHAINMYLNSSDPSVMSKTESAGHASFAANAQVFVGSKRISNATPDGTSNTIAFAEHYAVIYNISTDMITQFEWYALYPKTDQYPSFTRRFHGHRTTFADNGPFVRQWYTPSPPETPKTPAYIDVYPVTTSSGTKASIAGLTFQIRPTVETADPRIPQTPHASLSVAMLDGSVRWLARNMSESTFWAAVTPNGGEVLGLDWDE